MALKLIANYSKRLGLPGFSSHQYSLTLETELMCREDVPAEAERLYHQLQSEVDAQILTTGFVPPSDYGLAGPLPAAPRLHAGSDPQSGPRPSPADELGWHGPAWRCTVRQRGLILGLVREHALEESTVDAMAVERFGKPVHALSKTEASGLIDELLRLPRESAGSPPEEPSPGRRAA